VSNLHSKEYWEIKVQQWLSSGKSAKYWCKENQLVYTTFMGWRNRLRHEKKPKTNCTSKQKSLNSSSKTHFIELKNPPKSHPGMHLEYEGIKIHLSAEFDTDLLRRCLNVLQRVTC
jgi:hypothetical protein